MTDIIDQLDALAEKATAGPWRSVTVTLGEDGEDGYESVGPRHEYSDDGEQLARADADFFVALVNAWPAIRDRLRAAEAVAETVASYTIADNRDGLLHKLENWRRVRGGGQ
jgi:hypothetical protein